MILNSAILCYYIFAIREKNYAYPINRKSLYTFYEGRTLFNQNASIKYATDEIVKISKEGSRYIEDSAISQTIKDRYAKIPFIKELSEKFDTFVHFHETAKGGHANQFNYISYTKVSWADYSKKQAEQRDFIGQSPVSQELATEKMFRNVENCRFQEIA